MFSLVKIGMVLKQVTLGDEEETKDSAKESDSDWRDFCNGLFLEYEMKWTKKLEDRVKEKEEQEADA